MFAISASLFEAAKIDGCSPMRICFAIVLPLSKAALASSGLMFAEFRRNDEKIEDPARHTDPYGSFKENLRIFINVARRYGAHPVLITPLERRCFGEAEVLDTGAHGDYVAGMKEVAVEERVPLIDLYTMSRKMMNTVGKAETEDWFMNIKPDTYANYPAGQVDNTHLKYTGAVRFAGLIARGIKQLGGRYAELLIEYDFSTNCSKC